MTAELSLELLSVNLGTYVVLRGVVVATVVIRVSTSTTTVEIVLLTVGLRVLARALVVSTGAANLLLILRNGHLWLEGVSHHHGSALVHVHVGIVARVVRRTSDKLLLLRGIILSRLRHAHPHHMRLLEHSLSVGVAHVWHLRLLHLLLRLLLLVSLVLGVFYLL